MKKITFTDKYFIYLLNFFQLALVLLCLVNGIEGRWSTLACNIIWLCAIEIWKGIARRNIKTLATITLLCDAIDRKNNEEKEKKQENEKKEEKGASPAILLYSGHCDKCPWEDTDCKKVYLVGGKTICVKKRLQESIRHHWAQNYALITTRANEN